MWKLINTVSLIIFVFLMWWIYGYAGHQGASAAWMSYLPEANAIFNGLSTICLVAGFLAIMKGKTEPHKRYMLSALFFSALFLVSYLTHHHFNGDTLFTGTGWIRPVYFFILISHIVLTVFVLPLILGSFALALTGKFDQHKKVSRWTLPIWLYVSVTGVLIYLILHLF